MILYDKHVMEGQHREPYKAMLDLPITKALVLLLEREYEAKGGSCAVSGTSEDGLKWPCFRLVGHLPPHACATAASLVIFIWTDDPKEGT